MTPLPRASAPGALRLLQTAVSGAALLGLLVALLTAPPADSPGGKLVVDPGPVEPVVRELPIPAGAGELPATERVVPAREADPDVDTGEGHGHEHDEVVGGGPALASLSAPQTREFSMLGVTWADPRAGDDVTVEVRTRDARGWSEWEALHVESAPAPGDTSDVRGGTEPLWVRSAQGAQVRVAGSRPRDLRLSLIDPGTGPDLSLQAAQAGRPSIITRRQWGADPSLAEECSNGLYGITNEAVTVHHTVNSNNYTKSDADDLVRGIYAYHTRSNGWCDLGYNFLVDRYGQVFQGRRGSMLRQVWGAHAGDSDVNEQSAGVALIGNFDTAPLTRAMKRSLVRVTAWRLDGFFRNPTGSGNIAGTRYRRVMGHRDVKATACPGQYAYAFLPALRRRAGGLANAGDTPIHRRWLAEGGQGGWLGWPRVSEHRVAGGKAAEFRRGAIYRHRATGTRTSWGPVLRGYQRHRGPRGVLGFPRTNVREGTAGVPRGQHQAFQHGAIYRHPNIGPREVHGPIAGSYYRLGGPNSRLGFPRSNVIPIKVGLRSEFQGGRLVWRTRTNRTTVVYY
jgi:hypothetical protein